MRRVINPEVSAIPPPSPLLQWRQMKKKRRIRIAMLPSIGGKGLDEF